MNLRLLVLICAVAAALAAPCLYRSSLLPRSSRCPPPSLRCPGPARRVSRHSVSPRRKCSCPRWSRSTTAASSTVSRVTTSSSRTTELRRRSMCRRRWTPPPLRLSSRSSRAAPAFSSSTNSPSWARCLIPSSPIPAARRRWSASIPRLTCCTTTPSPLKTSTKASSGWSPATAETRFSTPSATPSTCSKSSPRSYRRVLLLISEARDHGSKHTKVESLIKKIGESDVLVLTVEFSPMTAECSTT